MCNIVNVMATKTFANATQKMDFGQFFGHLGANLDPSGPPDTICPMLSLQKGVCWVSTHGNEIFGWCQQIYFDLIEAVLPNFGSLGLPRGYVRYNAKKCVSWVSTHDGEQLSVMSHKNGFWGIFGAFFLPKLGIWGRPGAICATLSTQKGVLWVAHCCIIFFCHLGIEI